METKRETFEKATLNREYARKVDSIRAMLEESDTAMEQGDYELCSLLQASVTAMAHSVSRHYGRGFYEVIADAKGEEA
jgi:hypothetical protein